MTVARIAPTQQPEKKKIPPLLLVIGVAAVLAIIYFVTNNPNTFTFGTSNPEKQIEKRVNQYFAGVEEKDFQTVLEMNHPETPFLDDMHDFHSIPDDLTIDIHNFSNLEISEDYAEVDVFFTMSSFIEDESYTEDVVVELMRWGKDWYLYDIY